MKRASQIFDVAQRQQVADAVARAEQETAGEIVPVVASSSGRYDRGEDLFGVLFSLLCLTLCWVLFQDVGVAAGEWSDRVAPSLGLIPVLLIVLGGFLAGALLATLIPELRLPFVRQAEMEEEVERAAAAAFHRLRVRKTAGATGILIYVSLFERMVRVIGDEAISARLDQSQWEEVCEAVVGGMRAKKPAEGLCRAVELCGARLAEHFPIKADDRDELGNQLHLID